MNSSNRSALGTAYILGATGLTVNWFSLVFVRLRYEHVLAGGVSGVEKLLVGLGLAVSLVLLIGSTVLIGRELWPGKAEQFTPGQKAVAMYAILSLVIAVAMRIVTLSWLEIAAVIGGLNAIRYSYQRENQDMPDLQDYRIISFAAIGMVMVSMALSVIVRGLG